VRKPRGAVAARTGWVKPAGVKQGLGAGESLALEGVSSPRRLGSVTSESCVWKKHSADGDVDAGPLVNYLERLLHLLRGGDVAGLEEALHVLVLLDLERLPRLIDPVVVGNGLSEHLELAHDAAIRRAPLASRMCMSALTSQRRVVKFPVKFENGSASIRMLLEYSRPSLLLSIR
jgi:hypothetical protein